MTPWGRPGAKQEPNRSQAGAKLELDQRNGNNGKAMPKATFFNLPEDKRTSLVHFAIEEFSERPYEQASISRIVARAGIAKGSLYQYFDNKLDLFRYLLEEAGRAKKRYLEDLVEPDLSDFFSWLERLCLAGVRFTRDEPRLARLGLTIMLPTSAPELEAIFVEARRLGHAYFCSILEGARAAGCVRHDLDTRLAAHMLSHALGPGLFDVLLERMGTDMRGLLTRRELIDLSDEEIHEIVSQVVDLLRRGLAAGQR